MPDTEHMIFIMEMIGTVAFAVSGGMVAIRKTWIFWVFWYWGSRPPAAAD